MNIYGQGDAFLLPFQLWVETEGGVEPVIFALFHAIEGDNPSPWVTPTGHLDFADAFDTMGSKRNSRGHQNKNPEPTSIGGIGA